MMELLYLVAGCAVLVGVLYVVSALYRAYRLRQEQYEIAQSDAWEREQMRDFMSLVDDPGYREELRADYRARTRRKIEVDHDNGC